MAIFSKEAPLYWAKGISVIPLKVMDKRPLHKDWTDWGLTLPNEETQKLWAECYHQHNIGLALGPQSGIVCIDIDAIDPQVVDCIMQVLPPSPWKRVGAKGCVYAYKYKNEPAKKISDEHGKMIVEILSKGNQVVLPPSIHPDTGKPYVSNTHLYEVYDQLHYLPDNFEAILRASLGRVIKLKSDCGKFERRAFVASGSRDNQMVRFAGLLATEVLKGDCNLLRAITDMEAWCDQRVDGSNNEDKVDVIKGKGKIIEFIERDLFKGKMLPTGWDDGLTPEMKLDWKLDFSEDQKEWTVAQINDYMMAEFMKCDGVNDPKRNETVNYVLKKLAKSTMSNIEEGVVLRGLQVNSGLKVPLGFYTKELKSMKAGPLVGDNHTEIARAVVAHFEERKGKVCHHNRNLWEWVGNRWMKLEDQPLLDIVASEFGELNAAKKANDHAGILKVIKVIVPQVLTPLPQQGINFNNGFLTQDLKLVPHSPDQGMTYVLGFDYRPELAGYCPRFFDYLKESWGHHEDYDLKVMALQEAMAVTFFGRATSFQRAFLFYGPGKTGKSVLLDIVDAMMPQEARSTIAPTLWKQQFTPHGFVGKLVNRAGEIHNSEKIDGQKFKEIVSGEPIQVEAKNVMAYSYKPQSAHWFAGNHLPKSTDTTDGFNRRWLIFVFDKLVDPDKRIIDYGQTIASEEMEAIVAWAVQGMARLLKNGEYTLCPSHVKASEEMSLANSTIRQWLKSCTDVKVGEKLPQAAIWNSYWGFCGVMMASRIPSPAQFYNDLNQILMEQRRFNTTQGPDGVIYMDIAIKQKMLK